MQWFKGGQTNICYNAIDRHVEAGLGDKVAIFWEGNDTGVDAKLTYKELLERVCQVLSSTVPNLSVKYLNICNFRFCAIIERYVSSIWH